ncbi:hypothetical protein BH24ACI3_BH24ACI3_16640 [soil metagenome]
MNEKAINQPTRSNSSADFVAADRNVSARGKVIGHSGSDRFHNLLVSNTAIGLGSRMHGHKSEMYISNMRVRMKSGLICYTDIAIVNGEPSFADQNADVLLNPTLIVDIFSSSSDSIEKTTKLESFLEMESIKECLLIKQDEMRVEHYARQNQKQWIYRIYNERDDVVSLDSINTKLALQEIYAKVKFSSSGLSSKRSIKED